MIIKVCGMRDAENIRAVEQTRPDWMGFICWERSSRHVSVKPAHLPQCIRVGVFVDAPLQYILQMTDELKLNRIQLHGNEVPEYCKKIIQETNLPVTKAISVLTAEDIEKAKLYEDIADYILFDTKCKCVGGSGEQFDWDILQAYDGRTPFLLAGGIGPGDEERVLAFQHPRFAGIDLNSRFEISPALKDATLLNNFISKIRK